MYFITQNQKSKCILFRKIKIVFYYTQSRMYFKAKSRMYFITQNIESKCILLRKIRNQESRIKNVTYTIHVLMYYYTKCYLYNTCINVLLY